MSAKLIGLVFERYPEGGGEMILALKLADNAHHDGTHIYPSVATMAEMTRQSRRTVQYQLRRMCETGWLIKTKDARGGRGVAGYAAEYRINPEWIKGADFASLKGLSTGRKKKGAETAPNSEKGASDDEKGCKPEQERVQSEAQKGATAIAPQPSLTVIEPSENLHLADHEGREEEGDEKENDESQQTGGAFDRFWEIWPSASGRKAGQRSKCEAAWQLGALDAKVGLIVAHVQAMKLTKKWKDGWDPEPFNYLAKCMWEDGAPEPVAAVAGSGEATEWWLSAAGTESMAAEVKFRARYAEEPLPQYRVHVAKACGRGPWVDYVLKHAEKSGSQKFYEWVRAQLGDALLPPDDYAS